MAPLPGNSILGEVPRAGDGKGTFLRIIFEALKIDKMPKTKLVHLWFLSLFGLASLAYITMPRNGALDLFQTQLSAFLQREGYLPFPPPAWFSMLWRQAGLFVVSLWFILLYAVHWLFASSEMTGQVIGEDDSIVIPPLQVTPDRSPSMTALRAFPALLLLAATMLVPYILSLPAMGIPFYALTTMLSMTIFIVIFEGKSLPSAMEGSYKMTSGMKFFIFASFLFLRSLTTIAGDLLRSVFTDSLWAGSLIRAFFFALNTLAYGRLAGMFYRSLSVRRALDGH